MGSPTIQFHHPTMPIMGNVWFRNRFSGINGQKYPTGLIRHHTDQIISLADSFLANINFSCM